MNNELKGFLRTRQFLQLPFLKCVTGLQVHGQEGKCLGAGKSQELILFAWSVMSQTYLTDEVR